MSPYSARRRSSRGSFVLNEQPKGIINIVDATNIERNLYLTMQLMELELSDGACAQYDGRADRKRRLDPRQQMEDMLGIPVVPISAAKNEGIDELIKHAVHVAHYQERPGRLDFCDENEHGGAVHRCLHAHHAA
jgi:ferrous iron transport protein B